MDESRRNLNNGNVPGKREATQRRVGCVLDTEVLNVKATGLVEDSLRRTENDATNMKESETIDARSATRGLIIKHGCVQ